eukprot:scaffold75592_cov75-Cyclotella_meneghiniana.AAC.10
MNPVSKHHYSQAQHELGVGVGCRQSHAERSALHTLDNETSGGLARYSPNCSVLNNMLDLVDGLMAEAHFADRDR